MRPPQTTQPRTRTNLKRRFVCLGVRALLRFGCSEAFRKALGCALHVASVLVAQRGECRLVRGPEGGAASCVHVLQLFFPRRCARLGTCSARLGCCQGRLQPFGSSVPAAAFNTQASQLGGLGGGLDVRSSELLGKTNRGCAHFGGVCLRRPELVGEVRD